MGFECATRQFFIHNSSVILLEWRLKLKWYMSVRCGFCFSFLVCYFCHSSWLSRRTYIIYGTFKWFVQCVCSVHLLLFKKNKLYQLLLHSFFIKLYFRFTVEIIKHRFFFYQWVWTMSRAHIQTAHINCTLI